MSPRSALDELMELAALTERCVDQALVARHLAQSYAHHYRVNAEEFRKQAARARFPEIRERLLRVAASNERLYNLAELLGEPAGLETGIKPFEQRSPRKKKLRLQDPIALSEAVYLDTAIIIQETRDAIDSSLNRLRMRSNHESGTVPAGRLAPRLVAEAATGTLPEPTDGEPRQEAMRHKPDEDPVSQARRHVRQAEGNVARQEALVARLSDNDKHAALADQAKEILDTLRRTLSLAREHLALELKK